MAPGFIAIGSGPAGLPCGRDVPQQAPANSGAHPDRRSRAAVRKPALSKDFLPGRAGLVGCEAAEGLLAELGVATAIVAAEPVPLQRRFGDDVGERVAKLLSCGGVRFLGSTTVTAVDNTGVTLSSGVHPPRQPTNRFAARCLRPRLAPYRLQWRNKQQLRKRVGQRRVEPDQGRL